MKDENECLINWQESIDRYGPMWHVCTSGEKVGLIFATQEDFKFAVTAIAITAYEVGFKILVDTVMSTHIHVIGFGQKSVAISFISEFRKRIEKYLASVDRHKNLKDMDDALIIPITSYTSCRNEICYLARNPYVADVNVLPFSYMWGSAGFIFNKLAQNIKGQEFNTSVSYRTRRNLIRKRVFSLSSTYKYYEGMILPSSYADYKLAESFFRSAHHYLHMLTKNIEHLTQTALKYNETNVVTYEELYSVSWQIARNAYNVNDLKLIPELQRRELAVKLRRDYGATPKQIKRVLMLSDTVVKELFPQIEKY